MSKKMFGRMTDADSDRLVKEVGKLSAGSFNAKEGSQNDYEGLAKSVQSFESIENKSDTMSDLVIDAAKAISAIELSLEMIENALWGHGPGEDGSEKEEPEPSLPSGLIPRIQYTIDRTIRNTRQNNERLTELGVRLVEICQRSGILPLTGKVQG